MCAYFFQCFASLSLSLSLLSLSVYRKIKDVIEMLFLITFYVFYIVKDFFFFYFCRSRHSNTHRNSLVNTMYLLLLLSVLDFYTEHPTYIYNNLIVVKMLPYNRNSISNRNCRQQKQLRWLWYVCFHVVYKHICMVYLICDRIFVII